jgi:hypothetical protein
MLALLAAFFALPAGCSRAEPYLACSRESPCGSDAPLCLADTFNGPRGSVSSLFCTLRCGAEAATTSSCPLSGACVRLNGGDAVCLKRCTADSDCDFNNAMCRVIPPTPARTVNGVTTPASAGSSGARVCTVRQ